jgi:NAD(P)-dependent dehydrogenase (short-subunit alcohol dehydrogenase family)
MATRTTRKQPAPPFPPQDITPPGEEEKMKPKPRFEAPEYRGANKLLDQVAIITGGDSGIGRAVATLFAREGADLTIIYLAEEEKDAQETKKIVEGEGRKILLLPGDVCDPQFCRDVVQKTLDTFGRLDILVNNAAFQKHRDSLEEVSEEQWDKTFKTNIYGYFYMVKAALPHLKSGAAIINTGSITGLEGSGKLLDYSATKGAIHAFTKSLAHSLLPRGIRVNCVAPGPWAVPLSPKKSRPHSSSSPRTQIQTSSPARC